MPQKHSSLQVLAINSLVLYAGLSSALVIAAPSSKHAATSEDVGVASYQVRTWCRAEQFCFAVYHNGAKNMWLATAAQDAPIVVDATWLETSLNVFEGELTCCALKHKVRAAAGAA